MKNGIRSMRIAITGGKGFLAGYLINELLEYGRNVILLSRSKGNRRGINFSTTDYSLGSLNAIFCVGG